MKKVMVLVVAFILTIGITAQAQISENRNSEVLSVDDRRIDINEKEARKLERKRFKAKVKADKRKIKAMRKTAKADGTVTPQEKEAIKAEKRKLKAKMKARKKQRRAARVEQSPIGISR